MARLRANGIEIEYEAAGDSNDPALLMVMGVGAQLTIWPRAMVEGLAGRGFYVIRFDNRDVGLSTDFGSWDVSDIPAAIDKAMKGDKPYTVDDMAGDALGLLDALGIRRAHMLGASMGGTIVQTLAARHPGRTRSLVSVQSTSGRPGLPQARPEVLAVLTAAPEGPTREQRVAQGLKVRRAIGSPAYPTSEAELRALVELNVDRRWYPEGAVRQYLAFVGLPDGVEMLKTIKVPTLVLHGEADPVLPVECGRDVARLVPGAELQTYPGWGHDFPPQLVPTLVDRIATFCRSVPN